MKPLFPGQQENEQICLTTRQHWLTVVPKFLVWFFFAILPVVFDVIVLKNQPGLQEEPAIGIINLFKSIYLMGLMIALFAIWILYYLNFQIITKLDINIGF